MPTSAPRLKHLNQLRRPVIGRSIALLAAFCVLLVSISGWSLWSARQRQLEETAASTENMARALAAQAETSFKIADAILAETVERVEHDGVADANLAYLRRRFLDIAAHSTEVHGIFLFAPDGSRLVTSLPSEVKGNNADRAYFRYHQAHADRLTHVDKPVRSRSSGALVIPVTRRIDRPDGSFGGVALVSLSLDYFGRFYDSFDIGRQGTIILALDDATLLYRRPFKESMVGSSLGNGPIFRMLRSAGPVGTGMQRANIDGIVRLFSYRHLENYPLVVASALSRDEILDNWERAALKVSSVVVIAIALLGWGGARMIQQLRIREQLEAALRVQADSDGLTGLANRRLFDEALARELARARRTGASFALVLCDVDFFKKYNDRYGHVAGDDCLRKVARAIANGAHRPVDLAARYGGEEFVVLLPDTGLAGAVAVAESIRDAVAALCLEHADSATGMVSLSLGVVAGPAGAEPDGAWVEAADRALYAAKAGGRNRVAAREGVSAARAQASG